MGLKLFFVGLMIMCFQAPLFSQNGSLATSYTVEGCGLGYTQGSVRLNKRAFAFSPSTGVTQPASISISGIPACATIVKAFLYVGTSGNGAAITASITNPMLASSAFPMTVIGSDIDVCWSFAGTFSYRADVTSIVSGNGTYTLSGIPTSTVANLSVNDADGATLFIIYQDVFQTYTGNIVLADGCHALTPNVGQYASNTITGFSVCGTPTLTENFLLVSDLQQLGNTVMNLNTAANNSLAPNFNKTPGSDQVWDFITAPPGVGPATAGQTSANYGLYNSANDCLSLVMVGMYYRTNCLMCSASPINPILTLTATSTPSCLSSVTVNVDGGLPPYTYVWTGTNQTSSVVAGLSAGMYTVSVTGVGGCGTGSTSIEILTLGPIPSATSPTVCFGQTATLTAFGGVSYFWNGPSGFTSGAQSITVAPATTTGTAVYNILVTSAASCTGMATAVLTTTNIPAVQILASSTVICQGGSATLTPSGAQTYTWLATGLSQTQAIVVTPTASTVYSLQGASNGCKNANTLQLLVSPCTGMDELGQQRNEVMVYPNPSHGAFTIVASEKMSLKLINALGQQVYAFELNEKNGYQFFVSGLSEGIYYLTSAGSSSLITSKVIIEK